MTTKRKHTAKAATPTDPNLFQIENPVTVEPIPLPDSPQFQRSLGTQIVQAISEGRSFEVRSVPTGALLLVSGVEDRGHVYLVDSVGAVRDRGYTEKA